MDPLEFERYPLHEKIRIELIGKSYAAARIVAVVIESATSTAYSGLNGPLPQFADMIMSICKPTDRRMMMTALMYLHGTLRLMRRYGIPFSCDHNRPMRQLTSILLKEGCVNELLDQYHGQFEFLSMELTEEEREDFFFRAMPNGLAEDLPSFRTEDDCFPNTLPRDRWDVVGIKGLECIADFCMTMLVNRTFQDWILQYRDLNNEDYRRTQCPQVIKLVHDHIHRLKRGSAIHMDVLYPRLIPVNSFNNRGLYKSGITLPTVLLDWTLEVTPEEQFRISVPLPPPSIGVRSRYAPTPVPRVAHQGDREQSVRPKDPMRFRPRDPESYQDPSMESIKGFPNKNDPRGPLTPPQIIPPGSTIHPGWSGGGYRHQVPVGSRPSRPWGSRPGTTMVNHPMGPPVTQRHGATMTPRKDINNEHMILYQNTRMEKKGINAGFEQESPRNAIQASPQDVNDPTRTYRNECDIVDPLHHHALLATARENSITTKFEEEMKGLTADFEQKIYGLQQELLIHRKFGPKTNESIMIQTLQEKGIAFNSCNHCLVLLQHCPHVRPVEITNMSNWNHKDDDDSNRHLGIPIFPPECTAFTEEPTEEHVLFQALKPQRGVTNKVPQNSMGPEDSMGPDLSYRAESNEVVGKDLAATETPNLTEAPGKFVFHAPQSKGTLDNAPRRDSDYEELPEPNTVWSCQALRWKGNKDLNDPPC